jgi:hypothetical protein
MAVDWIKMRIDLQTHPKVVRIMSATKSDKFRVVGGLHAVWSVFDAHSEDGVLPGYSCDLMDSVIGYPGLSSAMCSVGWLEEAQQGIVMPEFTEHNGKSAKRRAEDQKRKRESRKCPQKNGQNEELERTREEKRREDNKNIVGNELPPVVDQQKESKSKALTSKSLVDIGVSQQLADDYMIMRKAKRLPLTQSGLDAMVKQFRVAGLEPGQGIDLCIQRGWASFKTEWLANSHGKQVEQPAPRPVKMLVPEPDKRVPMPESLKALARTL